MRSLLLSSIGLASALALGACTTVRITSAADHGSMGVVKLETIRTTNALLWVQVEHQFWLCQDTGDDLVCHRSCGATQDLQCPSAVASESGIVTNTR